MGRFDRHRVDRHRVDRHRLDRHRLGAARRATLVSAAGALLVGAFAPTAIAGAGEGPAATDWVSVTHSHVAGQQSNLAASWSTGDETWFAGWRWGNVGGVTEFRTLMYRCVADTCTSTYPRDIENPPTTVNRLYGVSGTSASDVWAVGYALYPGSPSVYRPVIHHWDGSTWQLVSNPVPAGNLSDVSAKAPDDVWAVGGDTGPLVLRYQGATWDKIPLPAKVSGCAPTDVEKVDATGTYPIMIGSCRMDGASEDQSMILTYRNASWQLVQPHGVDLSNASITAVAWVDKQAWVGGQRLPTEGLAIRMKHGTWRVRAAVVTHATIEDFAGSSPKNVWAVGNLTWPTAFSMHWDGKAWTAVDAGDQLDAFNSVSVTASGQPWANGTLTPCKIGRYDGPIGRI